MSNMKNLKSIIALLVLTVFSVNAFGAGTIASGTYVLCTSTSDLKAGEHYIIASGASGSVNCISNVSNGDNRKAVEATVSDSKITVASNSTIMTLILGGSIDAWTFYTDNYEGTNGYLSSDTNTSSTKNKCLVSSSETTGTISFSDDNGAEIRLKPHSSRTLLRYNPNNGSPLFACYSSGQNAIYLYKKEPDCTAPTTPLSLFVAESEKSIALNKTATITPTGGNGETVTYKVTTTSGTGTGSVTNGVFSATAIGTYKVSAHQEPNGKYCEQDADVTITVDPIQFDDYVTECCTKWAAPTVTYTTPLAAGDATATPSITGTTHGTASYESSNTAVLTVDADGTIHPQGAGTAYIIVTWGESTEGDVDYCENQAVSNTITVTGNISVAFDAKGGEGTMENQSMPSGTSTQLNACEFTKTGYSFQGWDTGPAGATVVYGDEEEVTLSEGCTLYAVWKINTYTISFEPVIGGSITVNGSVTSPVNVDYNATVTIEMTGKDSHFSPATLTYKVGEQVAVDILTDKSFNMPAGNVTLSYSFAEAAFKMITFYNNGIQVGDPIKAYVGEPIGALPEQGTMTSCDETSTTFIGWTAADISEKTTDKPATLTASTVVTSESAIAYNALWAEGGEATMPTPIIAWDTQNWSKETAYDASFGTGTMKSSIALTSGSGIARSGNAVAGNTNIVFSDLNLTGHSHIQLKFVSRGSELKTITASYSTNGTDYTDLPNPVTVTAELAGYTFNEIPSNATHVKLTYNASSSGSFFMGIPRFMEYQPDTYRFEELTAENTAGWTGSDWDGAYLVIQKTKNYALDGDAPNEKSYFTITDNEGVVTTTDLGSAFQISYEGDDGYTVKGVSSNYYISHDGSNSATLYVSSSPKYISSVSYNSLTDGDFSLYFNTTSFKFYKTSYDAITLYKLLPTSTNYITTCCTPLDAPTVEVSDVTTTTATLSWSSEQSEYIQSYQYTADPNTWPAKGTTSSSVELKNLEPNTEYTYYVRAKSKSDDYCSYSEIGSVTFTTTQLTVDITFDAATNGGTIDGQGTKVMQYTYNGEALTLPIPDNRTGYKFNGWFTSKTGNTQVTNVGEDNKPMEDKTYFAQWTQLKLYKITYNVPACVEAEPYAEGTSQYEGLSVDFKQRPENVDDWECIGWSIENPATATTTKPEILPMQIQTGLTSNMTVYAIYQKGEELPTGEFRISATWDDETTNYIAGRSNPNYSNTTITKENGKIFGVEDNQYVYFWNGETKTYLVNGNGTDLTVETNKNNLGNTAKWTIETDEDGYLLIHHNLSGTERYIAGKTVSSVKRFAAYGIGSGIYHKLTKHDIVESQALYTTAPCLPECVLSVSGNVHLTSGKDIAVYTTTPVGNVINVSAPHIDRAAYIQCTFLNENNEVDANAPFALCENTDTYAKVTNGRITTTDLIGEFNRTYAISYKPSVANHIDNYTLQLKAYDDEKVELSTCTLAISGRSLPEQFVIAIKKDNKWYAVPNELEKTAGATIPAAIEVNVNDNANPTYVIQDEKMSQITFQAASHPAGSITWRRGAIRLQRANAESFGFITATHTDNTSFYMPDNNADDQQLYLTSSDCNKYKVTLDPALYGNNPPTRWMSMDGTKIGWYKTQACDVYFLPVITEQIEIADEQTKNLSNYGVNENTTVIVHAGGTLNADKEATIGTLQIERKDGKSGQVFETATLTANNAYFDVTLNAAGMKWYDIAVPFTVDRLQGLSQPDGNKIPLNDVLVYNGTARATNGANGSAWQYQDDGDLVPGVGYDIMFASNVTTVRFTKKADAQLNNENEELAVSEFASSNPLDANWNYVANNSLHYVNLGFEKEENKDVVAQTYVPVSDSYTPYAQNEATYLVGTPFFVQVAADKVVWNIDETHSVLRAPAMTMNRVDRFTLEMSANGEMTDRLFVSADENARDEYQIGKDVAKMGVSSTIAQMWINNYNTKLCANEAVLTNGQATYQLGVFVPKDGEYTIAITSAPENATLYLTIDGQVVWNLSESAYVANLTKGTHNEFGLLLIANEKVTPTNINGLKGNNKAQKIFKDQNIYILRDTQMYNTQGVKVQ